MTNFEYTIKLLSDEFLKILENLIKETKADDDYVDSFEVSAKIPCGTITLSMKLDERN